MQAEAIQSLVTALAAGSVKVEMNMTRPAMIWAMVQAHPHVTGMTDLNVVDFCTKAVDAYFTRFPA
jgi:hypothetical protein